MNECYDTITFKFTAQKTFFPELVNAVFASVFSCKKQASLLMSIVIEFPKVHLNIIHEGVQ
jgi:hypothetical protein